MMQYRCIRESVMRITVSNVPVTALCGPNSSPRTQFAP